MSSDQYALANAWELGGRRLEALELAHDAASTRRLRAAGLQPGWRCLEVGAGRGSIARWLGTAVGTQGQVVAVDVDARFLRDVDPQTIEVVEADVVTDPLPAGPFDVHARLLLMHLAARDQLVPRLVDVLKPGGVLLLEEHDIPVTATADGAYGAAWSVFVRAMEAAGVSPMWVRGVPATLEQLGLADVTTDVDVPFFSARSPEAEFWRLTWLQAADRVVAAGVPRRVVDAGIEALEQPGTWFYGPAMVAVSGRRR
jgi:SAM-dependent methyltransferase